VLDGSPGAQATSCHPVVRVRGGAAVPLEVEPVQDSRAASSKSRRWRQLAVGRAFLTEGAPQGLQVHVTPEWDRTLRRRGHRVQVNWRCGDRQQSLVQQRLATYPDNGKTVSATGVQGEKLHARALAGPGITVETNITANFQNFGTTIDVESHASRVFFLSRKPAGSEPGGVKQSLSSAAQSTVGLPRRAEVEWPSGPSRSSFDTKSAG